MLRKLCWYENVVCLSSCVVLLKISPPHSHSLLSLLLPPLCSFYSSLFSLSAVAYYKAQTPWEKVAPQLHHWRQCKGYKGPLTVLLYVPPCFNAIMETEVRIPQTESLCCDLDQHMPPFLFFSFPSNIIRPQLSFLSVTTKLHFCVSAMM